MEILDAGLDLKAANGTTILRWVAINFAMASDDAHVNTSIPFLVTSSNLDNPIIGYNVIEEAIKSNAADCTNTANTSLMKSVIAPFHEATTDNIPTFIDFVYENAINNDDLCALKTSKKPQSIPNGGTVTIRCRANVGIIKSKIPVLFEPDLSTLMSSDLELTQTLLVLPKGKSPHVSIEINNPSKHNILLKGRTTLGTLQLVKSVTPHEGKYHETKEDPTKVHTVSVNSQNNTKKASVISGNLDLSKFDLSSLTPIQRSSTTQMLIEEADTFSNCENDIGSIDDLKLNLTLDDPKPVQKSYNSIPRPLFRRLNSILRICSIKAGSRSLFQPILVQLFALKKKMVIYDCVLTLVN